MIRSLGLSGFFLLHRDLLELAREVAAEVRGPDAARAVLPPGRGRGSSVASIVCFLTGPLARRPGREEAVARALPERGPQGAARHRPRLPARHPRGADPARARALRPRPLGARRLVLHLPQPLGDPRLRQGARASRRARSSAPRAPPTPWNGGDIGEDFAQALGRARVDTPRWQALVRLVRDATNLPRHVSQHPGGMVISTRPLVDICPIQPAAMEGRQMVHWDKESCADAGFLKIDLLGLGMLSAVERCVSEIARTRGELIDLSRIDFEDERGLCLDPAGRDHRHLPDREPRADADARADAAGVARRPDRPGGARPARADHRRRGASLHRAAQGASGGPGLRGALRPPVARAGVDATRSARSSSRTR